MGQDEAGTVARLNALHRDVIDPTISNYRGRVLS